MGTIVCQSCEQIIDHFESEKVGVLYGVCCNCGFEKDKNVKGSNVEHEGCGQTI